jgi:hypothetical protein
MTQPNERLSADSKVTTKVNGPRVDESPELDHLGVGGSKFALADGERELLREIVESLRTIRFGSIVLTVHEGQLVEINKSTRIRRKENNRKI